MAEDILARLEPFADLDPAALGRLARSFSELQVDAHGVIFRHGDPADAFFVVCAGAVALFRDQIGKPVQLLARREPGEFFGVLGLFDDGPRRVSARAVDAARLLRIPRRVLLDFLADHPDVAFKLQAVAAQRHSQNAAAALDLGRRSEVRICLRHELVVETAGQRETLGIENLSTGGVRLRGASASWVTGRLIRCTLIHGDLAVAVTARIAWRGGSEVGLAFEERATDHEEQIRRLLRSLLSEPPREA